MKYTCLNCLCTFPDISIIPVIQFYDAALTTLLWELKGGFHVHDLFSCQQSACLANPSIQNVTTGSEEKDNQAGLNSPRGLQKHKKSYRIQNIFKACLRRPTNQHGNNIPRIIAESYHPAIWGLHSHW